MDNWIIIRQQKQNIIQKNNHREKEQILRHQYRKGDKIIVRNCQSNKYEKSYTDPYTIIEILPQSVNVVI